MRYDTYIFSRKEIFIYCLEYLAIDITIAFLFYDSVWAGLILLPGIYIFFKYKKTTLKKKREDILKTEFIQTIASFSTAIASGFSSENALKEAKNDIDRMFEGSYMSAELGYMIGRIGLGVRIESVLFDFADRTGIREIRDFATVFAIAKKNGAAFGSSIIRCVNIMEEAKDTEREIEVLLSGKKYEQKIMTLIPVVLIAYLRYSSPDFIAVWYHNLMGIVVMTVCLGAYMGSAVLTGRIMDIRC